MSNTIIAKIKSKIIHIDLDELMTRLKKELKSSKNNDKEELIQYAMYDTLLMILDITHLRKIDENLYAIWVSMIKDYWVLNKYDKLSSNLYGECEEDDDENMDVSSIKTGDTQVNFSSKSATTNINGTTYSTGTINFDENILREKYKKDLYRHRKMRW